MKTKRGILSLLTVQSINQSIHSEPAKCLTLWAQCEYRLCCNNIVGISHIFTKSLAVA